MYAVLLFDTDDDFTVECRGVRTTCFSVRLTGSTDAALRQGSVQLLRDITLSSPYGRDLSLYRNWLNEAIVAIVSGEDGFYRTGNQVLNWHLWHDREQAEDLVIDCDVPATPSPGTGGPDKQRESNPQDQRLVITLDETATAAYLAQAQAQTCAEVAADCLPSGISLKVDIAPPLGNTVAMASGPEWSELPGDVTATLIDRHETGETSPSP